MRRVAIIGSEQTVHEPRKADTNVEGMIFDTVRSLLDKTGIDIRDIENVIGAGDDVLDGRSISNVFTAEYAGAFLKEESKVEDDGAFAASYAFMRIASGAFETALVYGYGKPSDSSPEHYSGMIADPFYLRPFGIESASAAAIQAQCYFDKYNVTELDAAEVAVRNRKHALNNPYLRLESELTVGEVMASRPIATPIKTLDAPPVTDGCCALLLASGDAVKRFGLSPAWIDGVSFCTETYYPGHRDLTEARSAEKAAARAYKMAGIQDKRYEIESAELHAPFGFQELMLFEALGLCDKGQGKEYQKSLDGNARTSINRSGGALSANPIFATGLIRLAEAASQISDQAASSHRRAIAHATSGFCLQSNIVYVMSNS